LTCDLVVDLLTVEPVNVDLGSAQGLPGPPGPPGSAQRLEVVQSTLASVWIIAHNFGYRPQVDTYSLGGREMMGEVVHVSVNVVNILFDAPVAGIAILV
jgi:hypothetical protein